MSCTNAENSHLDAGSDRSVGIFFLGVFATIDFEIVRLRDRSEKSRKIVFQQILRRRQISRILRTGERIGLASRDRAGRRWNSKIFEILGSPEPARKKILKDFGRVSRGSEPAESPKP